MCTKIKLFSIFLVILYAIEECQWQDLLLLLLCNSIFNFGSFDEWTLLVYDSSEANYSKYVCKTCFIFLKQSFEHLKYH